jgi:hypothetical protein
MAEYKSQSWRWALGPRSIREGRSPAFELLDRRANHHLIAADDSLSTTRDWQRRESIIKGGEYILFDAN